MLVFLPFPVVVGAVAGFPAGIDGLCEFKLFGKAPVGTTGFDFFEVAVGVAFDGFLAGMELVLLHMKGKVGIYLSIISWVLVPLA